MNTPEKSAAAKKSEYETSLSGKRVVIKTHGRIVFRGLIDSLEAEVIEAQVLSSQLNEAYFCACLGEVLDYLRTLMAAEVKETPLPPPFLFGMNAGELRDLAAGAEKNSGPPPLPDYRQGPLAARLNTLRTKIRETELFAVKVFGPGETPPGTEQAGNAEAAGMREDIILGLNRLSSGLWWLFCEYLSLHKPLPEA